MPRFKIAELCQEIVKHWNVMHCKAVSCVKIYMAFILDLQINQTYKIIYIL